MPNSASSGSQGGLSLDEGTRESDSSVAKDCSVFRSTLVGNGFHWPVCHQVFTGDPIEQWANFFAGHNWS